MSECMCVREVRGAKYELYFIACDALIQLCWSTDGADFIATTNDVVLLPLTSEICTDFTILNDNLAEAQVESFVATFATASDVQVGTNDKATIYIADSYSK